MKPLRVRLDVYIGAWNSELALTAPNTGCLDVVEFRIRNHRQYQPVFVSPSPPHPRCRARPLRIRWNCFFFLSLASLSRPTSSPPSAGEAGPPSPLSTGEATPPSPPSHVPALSLDPSTVASRDFDFDVDLIGLDSMQLVALRHLVLGRIGFAGRFPTDSFP